MNTQTTTPMHQKRFLRWLTFSVVWLTVIGLSACGDANSSGEPGGAAAETGGLTAAQLENGIGPISEVSLAAIDPALAEKGGEIFTTKCAACHKFEERYVGPPLEGVLDRRTPEFVMNMMLNPAEMVQQHPEVKKLLAEFLTPMPSQNLTEEDARAVLEYIRQVEQTPDN